MIKGIGADLTDRRRIQRAYDRFGDRFVAKVLCAPEITMFQSMCDGKRVAYLAKQFAGKEAVVKALGTGFSQGIALHQIEITRRSTGAPAVNLKGRALARATELGVSTWSISLSDDGDYALAFVTAEGS
jgi:holo-[acyl-carrier protein] synthase